MKQERNKGITLIALVVTIIVLLILAGISISMLTGQNGILNRAQEAKSKTENSGMIEKIKIAVIESQMNQVGYQKLEFDVLKEKLEKISKEGILKIYDINNDEFIYYVDRDVYKVSLQDVSKIDFKYSSMDKTKNRNANGEEIYSYNNPIIPKGFVPLETKDASWKVGSNGLPDGWNRGLVIMDESGNEFVWIPCSLQNIDADNAVVKYGCYINDSKFTSYQVDTNSVYDLQKYIPVENEFSQIERYQGFYVGRYETALSENIPKVSGNDIEEDNDVININNCNLEYNGENIKPVVQQGKEVWNCVNRENASSISEKIKNNDNIKSGLITGKQWDTMLKWIINTGTYDNSNNAEKYYEKIGNFYNSSFTINGRYGIRNKTNIISWSNGQYTKKKKEVIYLGTGVYENGKVNNIYDIYGNVWEITTETDKDGKMIQRGVGVNAGSNKAAGVHRHGDRDTQGPEKGFRTVLYIL